ncbi:hypothetical protein JTE90_024929 [Oedothorax gibbosus]|uniref:Uncharacterized protein n=1 Tax=Oedothorax gibbosus TaxID=931172 RepID=A0AAV6TDB0_9ARAC|nr:hypothetical protein JTE90_024929 [Oedothorax gibbosus]
MRTLHGPHPPKKYSVPEATIPAPQRENEMFLPIPQPPPNLQPKPRPYEKPKIKLIHHPLHHPPAISRLPKNTLPPGMIG